MKQQSSNNIKGKKNVDEDVEFTRICLSLGLSA